MTHPFMEEWECKEVAANDVKKNSQRYINIEAGTTFLHSYRRNLTWPAFKKCEIVYPETNYCFCCKVASVDNQGVLAPIDEWDNLFGISPLPADEQLKIKIYQDYLEDEQSKIENSQDNFEYNPKQEYLENLDGILPNVTEGEDMRPSELDYDKYPSFRYQKQHSIPTNGSIKSIDDPQCSSGILAAVNQTYVTLFYSSNTQYVLYTHPFVEEWECKEVPAYVIKSYNLQHINTQTKVRTFLQTYRRDFGWSPFRNCELVNPENDYCFCCKIDQARDQNQVVPESFEYWDNLFQISPLPPDEQLKFEMYWENYQDLKEDYLKYLHGVSDSTTKKIIVTPFVDYGFRSEEEYLKYLHGFLENATESGTVTPILDYEVNVEATEKSTEYTTTTTISTTIKYTVDKDQVLEELEALLKEEVIPITKMEVALDSVNTLFGDPNMTMTGELLQNLDRLGPRVDLEGSQSAMIVRDNLAVIVVESSPEHPVKGLRITTCRQDAFTNDGFDLISGDDYSQYLSSNESDAVVSLPSYITSSNSRMSFVVFRDDRAFQHTPGRSDALVNSRILSVNVENVTKFEGGGIMSLYLRPTTTDIGRHLRRACAYWRFLDDGTGYWSEDGCVFVESSTGMLDICQCDHLTHFAEVLIAVNKFSKENETILEILSITGCLLSILGILLVVVTAVVFKSWRKEFSNKVWLQLCLAILIFNICFLVKTFVEFDRVFWCMIAGVIMHYSLLVSFFWMLVAAIISYGNLVLVFRRDITRKLLKSSLFAWGSPLLIIGILLFVNPMSYINKFENTSRNSSFCYPSGLSLFLTVFLPLVIILLINWSIFIAILRSIFFSKNIRRHGNTKDSLRSAVVSSLLVFLFGLPWIFGLIAYNIIAAYIFTVTVSLQGFILFIFFIVTNKRTRDLWIKKISNEKQRSKPLSPTTTSESTSGRPIFPTESTSGRLIFPTKSTSGRPIFPTESTSGRSIFPTESTSGRSISPTGRPGPLVELQPFGSVTLPESDELKSLLKKRLSLSTTKYTSPAEKPDEYYE